MGVGEEVVRYNWLVSPETENYIGCSGGTMDNEQYSYSSKRLMEEPISIKIVIGL